MGSIKSNGLYQDPYLAQAAQGLAALFAPPSGADAAGWASAGAKQAETQRLKWLFDNANDPTASARAALTGVQGYGSTPAGFAATDATNRRGQDVVAATSRANNAEDNARIMAATRYGALSSGAVLPALPEEVARQYRLPVSPGVQGNLVLGQNQTAITPDGQMLYGINRPQTMDEWKAQEAAKLRGSGAISDQDIVGMVMPRAAGAVNYMTPDGKRGTAAPSPGGMLLDTQTGQPIPQGSVEVKLNVQATTPEQIASAGAAKAAQQDVVQDDIGRALAVVSGNPKMATGLGNQLTGAVGGTPAHSLNALLATIKANVSFDQLNAMRAASPTGGALGAVSDADMRLLQAVMGSLEASQSPQDLEYNLKRLANARNDIVHGPGKGPPRYDMPQMDTARPAPVAPAATSAAAVPPPDAVNMLRADPTLAPQFDAVFGPGAAQRVLGGQ